MAGIARSDTGEELWSGETMLAAWGDSSTTGQSIKLWLDEETERHPFAGCARRKGQVPGDFFAVVLAELDDDENPVHQGARDRAEAHHSKHRTFSQSAHLLIARGSFLAWLREIRNIASPTPESARVWVKRLVGIESLSDLDRNQGARERFRELVQHPYAQWAEQSPIGRSDES
jgi:hypothetical protein